jgi:hypothetical protein
MPFKLNSISDDKVTLGITNKARVVLKFTEKYCLINASNLALISEYGNLSKLADQPLG